MLGEHMDDRRVVDGAVAQPGRQHHRFLDLEVVFATLLPELEEALRAAAAEVSSACVSFSATAMAWEWSSDMGGQSCFSFHTVTLPIAADDPPQQPIRRTQ